MKIMKNKSINRKKIYRIDEEQKQYAMDQIIKKETETKRNKERKEQNLRKRKIRKKNGKKLIKGRL